MTNNIINVFDLINEYGIDILPKWLQGKVYSDKLLKWDNNQKRIFSEKSYYYLTKPESKLFHCNLKINNEDYLLLLIDKWPLEAIEYNNKVESYNMLKEKYRSNDLINELYYTTPTLEEPYRFYWEDGDDTSFTFISSSLEKGLQFIDDMINGEISLKEFFDIAIFTN